MALPAAVAVKDGDAACAAAFIAPACCGWIASAVFWLKARRRAEEFDVRHAFGAVAGIWIAICAFGSLPLWFSGAYPSLVDALFESVSGFTTTGTSVCTDVEALPRAVNLWRCETHWLGGLGVIALAVALIPLLGVGGFRLIKAETTGPEKEKFTNFIANTAKTLWAIYITLTAVQAILLRLCGLSAVDSLAHAFSTLGTGGFSTRNGSVGGFGLPAVEWICTFFMLCASVNFAVYYRLVTGRFREVRRDSELKAFLSIVAVAVTVAALALMRGSPSFGQALRSAAFQVASILSTTGFMTDDYLAWRPAAQAVIFALFFIGGCSGSTAGGIKVVRWTVLAKQLKNEMRRLLHPHEVFTLKLNGAPGRDGMVPVVASFIFAYFIIVALASFAGALAGLDMFTALTAALSMAGNIGPAFGSLGPTANCSALPAALKMFYAFTMLAGRLEIYTLLILVGRLFRMPRGASGAFRLP
ncbi:MAG: TrkH family potassium uptake protein [Kiritimatiellae bacterium]|nr:TrkH family potassium uptake protein [Kiritimatiellia bacterium]